MASTSTNTLTKISGFIVLILVLAACNRHKGFYKSDCDDNRTFKRIAYTHLIDSLRFYDKQYVEVTGKYQQGKDESALFNDSMFVDHSNAKALWVEFSPDCPLYLTGTRVGFFDYDYNNGKLTPVNNKTITLHGVINCAYKGHLGAYSGAIEHISYVKL